MTFYFEGENFRNAVTYLIGINDLIFIVNTEVYSVSITNPLDYEKYKGILTTKFHAGYGN